MADNKLYTEFPAEITTFDEDYSLYLNNGTLDGRLTIAKSPLTQVVNVKSPQYGALGDDVDDSTAIETALAATPAGGTLYFPPGGTYVIDTELEPPADNITFWGPGATIKLSQTPVGTEATNKGVMIQIQDIDGTHIEGIRFEGPATAAGYAAGLGISGVTEGSVVHIISANDTVVNNCQFIMNGVFKGGCVFVKGLGSVPSLRTRVTNNYAEKADAFTYAYSFTSHSHFENNNHVDGFWNSFRGTGNGSIATFTGTANLSFNDNGASADTITKPVGSFITDNFEIGDEIHISGTGTLDDDIIVVPTAVAALTITLPTGSLVSTTLNTSATIQADRNSTGNKVLNNVGINPAAMGIEDFESTVDQRIVGSQIIGNYFKDCGTFGISAVGSRSITAHNQVINPASVGIESGDQSARVFGNHIEHTASSPFRDTSVGIILDHLDGDIDRDGVSTIIGNHIHRFNEGIRAFEMHGAVIISGNAIVNSRQAAIISNSSAGETNSMQFVDNIIYYDIGTDEHVGVETFRVGISNYQASEFMARGNLITYTDTAGGGAQANVPILFPTAHDNVIYQNNIIKDNGVISGSTLPKLTSVGQTPDGMKLIDNNFGACIVDLTNCTNTIWENNVHTGVKTSFNKTTLLEFNQTTGVGTDAGTAEKTLLSDTIPAGQLDYTGKSVKIRAWGTTSANGQTKQMKLKFGATTLYDTTALAANNDDWYIEAIITRTGAATQDWIVTGGHYNDVQLPAATIASFGTAAETLSTDTTVEVTGQNGTATANDLVAEGFSVDYL